MKRALITGITGQDGSYLAEYLLSQRYEVHGLIRRASTFNTQRIEHIYSDPHDEKVALYLHYGDLSDFGTLLDILWKINPDEIYNLAAQSHVRVSFDLPAYTGDIDGLGTTRLLEAIRRLGIKPKFYQASSSEMFGGSPPPQNETTPFYPRSPYAAAKVYSYWMCVNYREGYNLHISNGILFNHESPRRGETFVTRKITRAIANILSGKQKVLYLGNLNAKRDWGYAPEYVQVMWRILQKDSPSDYVIGTGESHSVREFLEKALEYLEIEIEWKGKGTNEEGSVLSFNKKWEEKLKSGDVIIKIDPKYFRPTEVELLLADISKARKELGWEPKIKFNELIKIMVDYDMLQNGIASKGEGIAVSQNNGFAWTNHEYSFYEKIKERT